MFLKYSFESNIYLWVIFLLFPLYFFQSSVILFDHVELCSILSLFQVIDLDILIFTWHTLILNLFEIFLTNNSFTIFVFKLFHFEFTQKVFKLISFFIFIVIPWVYIPLIFFIVKFYLFIKSRIFQYLFKMNSYFQHYKKCHQ